MLDNLQKLLTFLADGKYYSSQDIAGALNLAEESIIELFKQLTDLNIQLEFINDKGYRLIEKIQLLNKDKISAVLPLELLKEMPALEILSTIPSTNDYLVSLSKTIGDQNIACFAEHQSQGKGRRGKRWISPFAKNITLSLLWHFPKKPNHLAGLSLAIAIAIIEALHQYGITKKLNIKWPNDIYANNQKLGGILIELAGETDGLSHAVIGIGINIFAPNQSADHINQPWTSVQDLSDGTIDRNALAGLLLNKLYKTIKLFQEEGFDAFKAKWQVYDLTYNKYVKLTTPTGIIEGKGSGIDKEGRLLLEISPGIVKPFASGDVSVQLKI